MKTCAEIVDGGRDVLEEFPLVDPTRCSVGVPAGSGLRIGFEGWGVPDVAIDPMVPLEMSISRLGLEGRFELVEVNHFLNYVHGDCTLTHAVRGIKSMLKPGGIARVTAVDVTFMAETAIAYARGRDYLKAQIIEKFVFRPPVEDSGLLYQQTMMNLDRMRRVFGMSSTDLKVPVAPTELVPDEVRLPGITDEAWALADSNNSMENSLNHDWPRCISCRRLATKMDENRRYHSRYCKDHYAEARSLSDRRLVDAFTFVTEFRKP